MIGAQQTLSGAAAYRTVAGTGAEPQELMKMALDGARTLLRQAEAAIDSGNRPAKAKALSAASDIVEFLLGLSGTEPGALSDCLAQVYNFVLAAILTGNAADDGEAIAAARLALDELAGTWRTIFPDAAV